MEKWIVPLVVAIIGAGGIDYLRGVVKAYRARKYATTPEAREAIAVATADQSLLVVIKARDELEDDNARLRVELKDERVGRAADRAEHDRFRVAVDVERRVTRTEIDELLARLRGLLDEVSELRRRHTDDE